MEHSESILKIAPAIVAAQAELRAAPKDSDNPFFHSKYADLASCMETLREVLHKNKLAVVQVPAVNGVVSVETVLLHESGEWVKCILSCQPKDLSPQAVGSAITYLRRYGLALTGLVTEEDDDGNTAQGNNVPQNAPKAPPSPAAPKPAQPAPQAPKAAPAAPQAAKTPTMRGIVADITTPKNAGEPYLVTFADSDKAGTYNADIGLELLNEYKCEIEIVYSINAKKNKIIEEFKHISGEALPFH